MYVILTVFILAIGFTVAYVKSEKSNEGEKLCACIYFLFFWIFFVIIFCVYANKKERESKTVFEYEITKLQISSAELITTATEIWLDTTCSRTAIQEKKNGMNSIILRHRMLLENWYLKDWGSERIAELELLK